LCFSFLFHVMIFNIIWMWLSLYLKLLFPPSWNRSLYFLCRLHTHACINHDICCDRLKYDESICNDCRITE
jgi:hypothetical protein